MLILQTLQWGPQHGYGIVQALRLRSGEVLQVETGSLYPALHPTGAPRLGAIRMETVGEQAKSPILPDHGQRKEAIGFRSEQMGTDRGRNWLNHAWQTGGK
jgi:hypothetical protein